MILPPDLIMKPHLRGDDWLALSITGGLGAAAFLGGLWTVRVAMAGRSREPGAKPPLPAANGVIGVLAGSVFLFLALVVLPAKDRRDSVAAQRLALRTALRQQLVETVSPELFLRYVHVGAVGLNDDFDNGTALAQFTEARRPEAVRRLLDAGALADVHAPGQDTPLKIAVRNDDPVSVALLLAARANPNAGADEPVLFDAVDAAADEPRADDWRVDTDHRSAVVSALVGAGAKLNIRDERSYTPLMVAAAAGRCDLVAALIKGEPDQSLKASTGETALDWAQDRHPECAHLLR